MAKRPTSTSKKIGSRTSTSRVKTAAKTPRAKKLAGKSALAASAPAPEAEVVLSPAKAAAASSISDLKATKAFAIDVARALADDKCEDVQLLDVTGLSQVSDFIILGSGTSDRQMRSAGDDAEKVGDKHGWKSFRRHDDDRTTWIVVDFVDVVVHVFEPNTRAHYDLEMLWADAPRLEWERPDQVKRDRAGLK